jgi:hypothetical protein
MKPFTIQKILIPIDFSETSLLAIEHAAFTAQLYKAELVLLHVVEKYWEKISIITPELEVKVPEDFMMSIEKKLEEVAEDIRSKYGVKSDCITSNGNIFTEIMSVSKEKHVDLVVMGTHGASGIAEFFVGSNTYKVVTKSSCPVLSVQGTTTRFGYKDILLPIDDSMHSRQKVNHAIVLAKQFASKLHVLGLPDKDLDDVDMRVFEVKLTQIVEYAHKCGVLCDKTSVKGANQAKVTLDYANNNPTDLIVIMTDQEESITGRLIGTYAQQIVNHSKIPVMSIHPVVGVTIAWENPY